MGIDGLDHFGDPRVGMGNVRADFILTVQLLRKSVSTAHIVSDIRLHKQFCNPENHCFIFCMNGGMVL